MGIKSKGYQRWDGSLMDRQLNWLPIFRHGISNVFRKKKAKVLYIFASIPFVIFAVIVYILTKPELKVFTADIVRQYGTDEKLFSMFFTNGFLLFVVLLISIHAGSGQIAGDLKWNALTLYFARPITKTEYVLGKMAIVFFYVELFTLVPGILLIFLKILFVGSLDIDLRILGSTILFPILVGLCFASMSLCFSAMTRSSKLVAVIMFVMYFSLEIIYGILRGIFRENYLSLISLRRNIEQFGNTLFGATTRDSAITLGWWSGVVLILMTGLFFGVLICRVRKLEG